MIMFSSADRQELNSHCEPKHWFVKVVHPDHSRSKDEEKHD